MAKPINNWAQFKKTLRELKDPAVKETFQTIIIDTADIAYDYCTSYICANNDAYTVSDIPYGKGYGLIAKEFDDCLRSIVQMDYGLVIISHETDKTFTDEGGNQFNKIVPTLDKRANNIVARMTDIIGYARSVTGADGKETTKLFMRGTSRFEAGSRFKYTPDYIDFSYKNLVNAIGEAIDKQAKENGEEYFTDTKQNLYEDTSASLDFDELMKEFQTTISSIPGFSDANNDEETEASKKFLEFWSPRITEITDKYLGKGKKVGSMNRDQVEQLDLIVSDLKELVSKNS